MSHHPQLKPHHCLTSHQPFLSLSSRPSSHLFHPPRCFLYPPSHLIPHICASIAYSHVIFNRTPSSSAAALGPSVFSPLPVFVRLLNASWVTRPCASTRLLATSAGRPPHLSPMCSISPKAITQRCIDKRQPCQSEGTHQRASGSTVRTPPPLPFVCIVRVLCQWSQ